MIVISIIGVLAAIATPMFKEARKRSNQRACYANQKTIAGALTQWSMDANAPVPASGDIDWDALKNGGFLQAIPPDPGQGQGSHAHYVLDATVNYAMTCTEHGPIE